MGIPDEDVARVRAATDVVALIGEHTALKRVGRRFQGLCPFHSERTPSFSVNAEEGLYYCFGCQAHGDAITFVRETEGLDFVDAVERLAMRAGITIRRDAAGGRDEDRTRRKELLSVLEKAATFYHERLLERPDAGKARNYLRSRGYDGEVVRKFRLGYAPAGFDELTKALGAPPALLRQAGIAFENQRGRMQDAFRDRVMFPILDAGGQPIAFGGRVLPEQLRASNYEAGPKYRNSPESPIYQKRRTLYGLNWAKAEMSRTAEAIVCEGYTDVIGFHLAGIPQAVATCGTALTEDHFQVLSHFAKRVVLAFDADAAGEAAAARLYQWEKRHEIELAVAELPEGDDPAELARNAPDALAKAVQAARPFLGFRIERALAASDLRTPEGRSRAAEEATAAIAEHPNEIVRDQYLIDVADRTQIAPDRLRALVTSAASRPKDLDEQRRTDESDGDGARPERGRRGAVEHRRGATDEQVAARDALICAIEHPEDARALFNKALFSDPIQRAAFHALANARDLATAIERADPVASELLRVIAVSEVPDDLDAEGTYLALVRASASRALRDLESEARVAQRDGRAEGVVQVLTEQAWLRTELQVLHDPLVRTGGSVEEMATAKALVAWLADRQQEG
ncbi:MAG: DNA primase [Acidimicrobiales bacterium]